MFKHHICWNKRLECKKEKKRGTTVAFSHTEVSALHTHSVSFCSTDCISKALQKIHSSNAIYVYHFRKTSVKVWLKPEHAAGQDPVSAIKGSGWESQNALWRWIQVFRDGAAPSFNFCQHSQMLSHQQAILACAANHLARQHLSCSTDTPSYSATPPLPACQPSLGNAQQLECWEHTYHVLRWEFFKNRKKTGVFTFPPKILS